MSSKVYETSGYGHSLDLLIILINRVFHNLQKAQVGHSYMYLTTHL